jgi:hypothetical protein
MDWNEVTSAIKATKFNKPEPSEPEKVFDDFFDMSLALVEWFKSQDIAPQKAGPLMATFLGTLVGVRADSFLDAIVGADFCIDLVNGAVKIQMKRRQENGEKIVW